MVHSLRVALLSNVLNHCVRIPIEWQDGTGQALPFKADFYGDKVQRAACAAISGLMLQRTLLRVCILVGL